MNSCTVGCANNKAVMPNAAAPVDRKPDRNGKRKNPVMAPFAEQLTDQDIEALAEYFDRKPGLVTPELP
jgi:mono/diheme cytochrome c family protein